MAKSDLSKHTVAELRDMCKRDGLSSSGNKSTLVNRLNEAKISASKEADKKKSRLEEIKEEMNNEDDDALILEDDEEPRKNAEVEIIEAEVFEAEVLEAEPLEAETVEAETVEADIVEEPVQVAEEVEEEMDDLTPIPATTKSVSTESPKRKVLATIVVISLLAITGWWYYTGGIEPFTPDPIRYGDSMHYTVSGGVFSADGEFVERALELIDSDEDEICKLSMSFSGTGDISVTNGEESELAGQLGNEMLGAVSQRGSYGYDWLTVEKNFAQDFDDVSITRYKQNLIDSTKCNDAGATSFGNTLLLDTKTWKELRSEDLLRSQIDYQIGLESSAYAGSLTTFGLSGILSSIGTFQSSISMAFAPVELKELIGDTLIQDDSSGSRMGWDWRVVGSEEKAGEMAWRIFMESEDIKKYCLGHAHITIWASPESPWATSQDVDIQISGDSSQGDCDTTSQLINDLVVPDGTLEMRMNMQSSDIERGEKAVVFGRDYDNRPRSSDLKPSDSELDDWGSNQTHLPDQSSRRVHTLEDAVACIPHLDGAPGAKAALGGEGYVWRGIDNRSESSKTNWNISWVDSDDMSGWVRFDVTGDTASSENCTYLSAGSYEDGPSYDRDEIPESLNLAAMESRLLDSNRYPELTSGSEYLGTPAQMHDNVRYGHLIATAGTNLQQVTQWLDFEDGAGAATVDLSRSWNQGQWTNSFTLAADATDGRVVGWAFTQRTS